MDTQREGKMLNGFFDKFMDLMAAAAFVIFPLILIVGIYWFISGRF